MGKMQEFEAEIAAYYAAKEPPKIIRFKTEEINVFFDQAVTSAFKEIEKLLSPYVQKIKIYRHKYIAKIRIAEEHIQKSVWGVKVDRGRGRWQSDSVYFPYEMDGRSKSVDHLMIDNLSVIDKDFIVNQFMTFFRERDKIIAEWDKSLPCEDTDLTDEAEEFVQAFYSPDETEKQFATFMRMLKKFEKLGTRGTDLSLRARGEIERLMKSWRLNLEEFNGDRQNPIEGAWQCPICTQTISMKDSMGMMFNGSACPKCTGVI